MSARWWSATDHDVRANDSVVSDNPVQLADEKRVAFVLLQLMPYLSAQVEKQMLMWAKWTGAHRDWNPVSQFPVAFPLLVVFDGVGRNEFFGGTHFRFQA